MAKKALTLSLAQFITIMQGEEWTVEDQKNARRFCLSRENAQAIVDAIDNGLSLPGDRIRALVGYGEMKSLRIQRYQNGDVFHDDSAFTPTLFAFASEYIWDDSWEGTEAFLAAHAQLVRMFAANRVVRDIDYLHGYREAAAILSYAPAFTLIGTNFYQERTRLMLHARDMHVAPGRWFEGALRPRMSSAEIEKIIRQIDEDFANMFVSRLLAGLISDDERAAAAGLSLDFLKSLYPQCWQRYANNLHLPEA